VHRVPEGCSGFLGYALSFYVVPSACLVSLSMVSYLPFLSLFYNSHALTVANARIASLEAKLDASRKAWDVATTAKVAAEKTAKSAETKEKKAEKALVTADQKRAHRDLAVAERMDKIFALLGGKHRVILFFASFSSCS
jgi:hypothetical protein